MKKPFLLILSGLLALQMQVALAKDAFIDLPVDGAAAAGGASPLSDVRYFMAGQEHPAVVKTLGDYTSNRSSNATMKSNEASCSRAFLSALIALQERAKTQGGNAVIDIKSITKHNDLVSATQFRCADGTFASNVALSGTVATLK
jgi:uncharacterized protein YbjQ (UPF0145 family)